MAIEGGIKNGISLGLSEVGKIKIGGKGEERKKKNSPGTFRLPVKFGHFKVTTTERDGNGDFILDKAVMDAIGPEPKEIRIQFPFDNRHMNFQTSFQYYEGSKKMCEGDGISAERHDKDGKIITGQCDHTTCKFMANKKCKPSGRLSCYLPDSPHRGGIYRFRTHGWNSVGGIMAALKQYSDYTDGMLQGLPFKLVFTKKATEEHGNVPVVTLVLDGIELDGMRDLVMAERTARVEFGKDVKLIEHTAIKDGFLEDTDSDEDVAEEFYSDAEEIDGSSDEEAGATAEEIKEAMTDETETDAVPDEKIPDEKTDKDLF
jgi:hypothetical protein